MANNANFGQDAALVRKVGSEASANGDVLYKNYASVGGSIEEYGKKTGAKAVKNQAKEFMETFMPQTVVPIKKSYQLLGETLITISKQIEDIDN